MSGPFTELEAIAGMPARIPASLRTTWEHLAEPGDWWTGSEKVDLAAVARHAFGDRFAPPWMRTALTEERAPADAASVVTTLAADARTIDRAWADGALGRIGDAAYVELVALAATIAAVDAFAEALGVDPEPLPSPTAGEPERIRPSGMGDIGAYVPMAVPWRDANVARALTLSPAGNRMYRGVAVPLYHDGHFLDLAWERTISRPQAEVIATAVSAVSECFY